MDHTIKPGKYITRSNHVAVILCNDAPGNWPIIGYVILPDEDYVEPLFWKPDGSASGAYDLDADDDLVAMVSPL